MKINLNRLPYVLSASVVLLLSMAYKVYNDQDAPLSASTEISPMRSRTSLLSCAHVRELTNEFVRSHYTVKNFDAEISARSYDKFFQALDPGKTYFLQEDYDSFKPINQIMYQKIRSIDCRFITDINNLFLKRVKETEEYITQALAKPFDFQIDEFIETDRKKIAWAKDKGDLSDRWRKLAKLSAMQILEADPAAKDLKKRLGHRFELARENVQERSSDKIFGIFLDSFASSLDPHSQFLLPEEQEDFNVSFQLKLVGIGASLTQVAGYTIVDSLLAGGAASRDGRLKKGDKIIAVDPGDDRGNIDVIDMDLGKVVQLIRGKEKTKVTLSILRKPVGGDVARISIQLVRDVVHLSEQQARSDIIKVNDKKIGVINLPSFYLDYEGRKDNSKDYRSSALDTMREVKKLTAQKVDGIIFDLRRNGGGDLGECIKITGQFIDKGSVVQVRNRDGEVESLDDTDEGTLTDVPMAVLISKQSASASEIFAGAIQDYGRGIIVGNSHTYGKGTVQTVMGLPSVAGRGSNGAMKVTISKFYRPSGKSNQEKGVYSDIVIPDIVESLDISEAENDFVLPYDTIKPQKYFKPITDLSRYVPDLKVQSDKRIAASNEFKALSEKIKLAEAEKGNSKLPLKKDKKALKKNALEEESAIKDSERNAVVRKDDIELFETANIVSDLIDMEVKSKK